MRAGVKSTGAAVGPRGRGQRGWDAAARGVIEKVELSAGGRRRRLRLRVTRPAGLAKCRGL